MLLLSLLAAAIAPGISLLTYFYLKDRYDAEPVHMVARMFALGVAIALPIMALQWGLNPLLGNSPFTFAFLLSAGIEECLKWLVLYQIIYKHKVFDEPYDGIVYATAVALGFATLENVLYAFLQPSTFGSLLVRALLPVSGHALFGVMMGYYLGKAKFADSRRTRGLLTLSLALPVFWHGLYDWIMGTVGSDWVWFIVPLMAYMWFRGIRRIQRANARSPFRILQPEDEVNL